ncbi:hypothetical protein PSPO01_06871 [Paraphaeosphaeria sporulosa]
MYTSTLYEQNKGAEPARILNAHPSAAPEFPFLSSRLLYLPLELRNIIYAHLYTESTPGRLLSHELLRDPGRGARAAGMVSRYRHYGSSVAPQDVLTKLYISRPLENLVDLVVAPSYAAGLRDFVYNRSARLSLPKGAVSSPLLKAPHLRSVEFRLSRDWSQSVGTPEMLMLKMREMRGWRQTWVWSVCRSGVLGIPGTTHARSTCGMKRMKSVGEKKPVDVLDWELENEVLWKKESTTAATTTATTLTTTLEEYGATSNSTSGRWTVQV